MSLQPEGVCPVDGKRFDPGVGYAGKILPMAMRRGYCCRGCARTAAQQRGRDAASDRLATALGPDGVRDVVQAARESGQPVVIEDLTAPRRTGGLGPLGGGPRWDAVDAPKRPRAPR